MLQLCLRRCKYQASCFLLRLALGNAAWGDVNESYQLVFTHAAVRPSKTSKAFWEAMTKVQSHLTDAKKIAAYNQRKEQKLKVRLRL